MSTENTPKNWGFRSPDSNTAWRGWDKASPDCLDYTSVAIFKYKPDYELNCDFKGEVVREYCKRVRLEQEKNCEQQLILHLQKQLASTKVDLLRAESDKKRGKEELDALEEELALEKRKVSWLKGCVIFLGRRFPKEILNAPYLRDFLIFDQYPEHVLKGKES